MPSLLFAFVVVAIVVVAVAVVVVASCRRRLLLCFLSFFSLSIFFFAAGHTNKNKSADLTRARECAIFELKHKSQLMWAENFCVPIDRAQLTLLTVEWRWTEKDSATELQRERERDRDSQAARSGQNVGHGPLMPLVGAAMAKVISGPH